MADFRRTEILSGAFIVGALALFTFFIFRADESTFERLFGAGEEREYNALVPMVQGLREGSEVRLGGLPVGEVAALRLVLPTAPERARWTTPPDDQDVLADHWAKPDAAGFVVRFVLRREALGAARGADAELFFDRERTTVHIRQDGLIGDWYLDLVHAAPLADGSRDAFKEPFFRGEPVALWGRADGLFDTVQELMEGLREPLQTLTSSLQKVESELLSKANLELVTRTLEGFEVTVQHAQSAVRNLDRLLTGEDPTSLEQTLIRDAREMIRLLDERLGRIELAATNTLAEADRFLAEGQSTIAAARTDLDLAARSQELGKLMSETLPQELAALRMRLNDSLAEADRLMATWRELGMDARPEVAGLIASLRRAAFQLEVAFTKVRASPNVLIFGDDEQLAEPVPAEASGLLRTGRVPGFGQRSERDEKPR